MCGPWRAQSLKGEFLGFDAQIAGICTGEDEENIEAEEVIDVWIEYLSEGPE